MSDLVDIADSKVVEIEIRDDGKVLWVNVDGVCRLRFYEPGEIIIIDHRKKQNCNVAKI